MNLGCFIIQIYQVRLEEKMLYLEEEWNTPYLEIRIYLLNEFVLSFDLFLSSTACIELLLRKSCLTNESAIK
jgi:hypothetical protein